MDVDTENESSSNGNTHNELYPIAVLIDELKSDNDDARLRSVKSLARIGKALGPERTRNELVPFVTESCDDNDDILKAIAASISELVLTVGGEQFAYTLLQPLESLCLVEDSGVRDAAIQAFKVIADAMPAEHHGLHMAPLIRNLCDQDWFTSRISAALAIPTAYEKATEDEGVRAEYVPFPSDLVKMGRDLKLIGVGKVLSETVIKRIFAHVPLFQTPVAIKSLCVLNITRIN